MSVEQERDSKSTNSKSKANSELTKDDLAEVGIDSSNTETIAVKDARKEIATIIEALKSDLDNERKKNAEISKKTLYLQADYANLQRLSEKRISEARDETRLRFIEEYISLKEDLERAMSVAKTSTSLILFDGLRMLLSRLEGTLRSEEVERINAPIGSTFDPRLHEAVAYSEGNSEREGTILSVVSNGYMMRGKVIKPALVEVARQSQNGIQEVRGKENPNDDSSQPILDKEDQTKKGFKEEAQEQKISSKEQKVEMSSGK